MMTMPKAPKLSLVLIGPGIVLIAMGLGSGEFILWPYLVAQYGFGILWGALVGITFQYFVSNESGRYTIATGGSIYTAFYKLGKWIPYWFIASTFLSFAWPGIIGSGGTLISEIFNINDPRIPTIFMLLLIGLLLTFGGKVYENLERVQKLFIIIALPILIFIAASVVGEDAVEKLSQGFLGIGEGYNFFPSGISLMAFLGSVAYSGAAGNLILSHSFYVQDEGYGMAGLHDSQVDIKNRDKTLYEGQPLEITNENVNSFKSWFRISSVEQLFSFWFVGLISIILLSIISYYLVYPFIGSEDLGFIILQHDLLSGRFGNTLAVSFLIIGAMFLFTTQLGIFETTSRIMTENIQLASERIKEKYARSTIFFTFLWAQILAAIAITLFGLEQPIQLILIGTFFSALSMLVLSGLILWLNTSKFLPTEIQPGLFRKAILALSVIFFFIFVSATVIEVL